MAEFKQGFTYANVGNLVGTLVFVKELKRKDGTVYGHEFLVNVKGHGSINVRIPMLNKSQATVESFPIGQVKPKVRFPLVSLDAFFSTSGKVYLNLTTFNEGLLPVKADGTDMEDIAKGRVAGEVAKTKLDKDGNITFLLAVHQVDKDGNQLKNRYTGKPFPPKAIPITIVDDEIKKQWKEEKIVDGANIDVGYMFVNKNDVGFDEYGLPTGSGKKVQRIEAKRIVVHSLPKVEEPIVEEQNDPFADDDDVFGGVEVDPFSTDFDIFG